MRPLIIHIVAQAHTIDVHNASAERKMAENLVVHLENGIGIIRMVYLAILVAVVMDASGECHKARKILAPRYPDVVFLNCYAHQVYTTLIHCTLILMSIHKINLVVGDYFKSQTVPRNLEEVNPQGWTQIESRVGYELTQLRGAIKKVVSPLPSHSNRCSIADFELAKA